MHTEMPLGLRKFWRPSHWHRQNYLWRRKHRRCYLRRLLFDYFIWSCNHLQPAV